MTILLLHPIKETERTLAPVVDSQSQIVSLALVRRLQVSLFLGATRVGLTKNGVVLEGRSHILVMAAAETD